MTSGGYTGHTLFEQDIERYGEYCRLEGTSLTAQVAQMHRTIQDTEATLQQMAKEDNL